MTPIIDKLLEECKIETYGVHGELLEIGFDAEKFAELIVAGANKRVNQYIADCGEVNSLPEYILEEHFGIKS